MGYVDFISDEHFKKCVKYVCDGYNEVIHDEVWLHKHGLDVFKIMFDMGAKKLTYEQWRSTEELRRDDKTISNKVGNFHQLFLGGVNGWTDLKTKKFFDLKKDDNSIFIELKNKENTTNSGMLQDIERRMDKSLETYPSAIYYWAYLVAKNGKSEDKEWKSENKRRISGARIYELVTGDPDALKKTWQILPKVIEDVLVCNIKRDSQLDNLFEKTFFRTETIQ